jgi:hypothetical protein
MRGTSGGPWSARPLLQNRSPSQGGGSPFALAGAVGDGGDGCDPGDCQQQNKTRCGRWRRGESLRLIARRLGRRRPSVRAFVRQTGGVQQPPRRRPARSFSADEREAISRGIAAGDSGRGSPVGWDERPRQGHEKSPATAAVPSPGRRRRCLPEGAAAQACQARDRAATASGGGGHAGPAVVAPADRRLAPGGLS